MERTDQVLRRHPRRQHLPFVRLHHRLHQHSSMRRSEVVCDSNKGQHTGSCLIYNSPTCTMESTNGVASPGDLNNNVSKALGR